MTKISGHFKLLAPPIDVCPKCGSTNTDKTGYVWRVADERGMHWECDACAHAWTIETHVQRELPIRA